MTKRIVTIFSVVLASTACASFPVPTETIAASQASVRGAEELGAADVPEAALKLQLANEQVVKAEQLMEDGANEQAHYMALRAAQDADLAIALVREDNARSGSKAAKQSLEQTQSELSQ
jgi:hypothetical protein